MLAEKIKEIVHLAQKIKTKLSEDNLHQNQKEILSLLELLERLDLEEQYYLEKYKAPAILIKECSQIKKLAQQARSKILFENYVPGNILSILNKIIELEQLIQVKIEPIVSTFNLKRILNFRFILLAVALMVILSFSQKLLFNADNKGLQAEIKQANKQLIKAVRSNNNSEDTMMFIYLPTQRGAAKRTGVIEAVIQVLARKRNDQASRIDIFNDSHRWTVERRALQSGHF